MNKTTPKKIMEIIFIFILPLFIIVANLTYTYDEVQSVDEFQQTQISKITYLEYENYIVGDSPIRNLLEIPFGLLGINTDNAMTNIIIDYTSLWFTMFIIWHLLYLFFDTLMHKVLLRKD